MIIYRRLGVAVVAVLTFGLAGCGLTIPSDPDGTLGDVRGGTLRVGVSENGDWVTLSDGADPAGSEPELVRDFAATLDAEVIWTEGSEQTLVDALLRGSLDLVVAGLPEDTPWSSSAALTRPYVTAPDPAGEPVGRVMLVPPGENTFLLELDRFLLGQQRNS